MAEAAKVPVCVAQIRIRRTAMFRIRKPGCLVIIEDSHSRMTQTEERIHEEPWMIWLSNQS
jgi:hypothetical protein